MGKLLVLEGLDGAGKSTQIALLEKALAEKGIGTFRFKAPDYDSPSSALVTMYLGGAFGTDPSDVNAYAASTFYAADRYACFRTKWKEAYEAGKLILADRYTTSNAVFQMPKLPKDQWDSYLSWLADFEYGKLGLPEPDRVLYLDIPVAVSQSLLEKRYGETDGKKDVHEADVTYQNQCREAALYAAQREGWTILHSAEDGALRSPESISEELVAAVADVFC